MTLLENICELTNIEEGIEMFEKLFEPITIKNVEIKNRLFVPPMVVNFCGPNGEITEEFTRYHEEKAKGGFGLITIEQAVVSRQGKGHPGQPVLWSDDVIEGLKEFTTRIHTAGAKLNVQINHAGRQALSAITGGELVAPTAVRDPYLMDTPHELTKEEIKQIVEDFGEAALRAKKAGFDMIMEHAHHGYLIGSFLSPYSNKRSDEYGGSLLNRARLMMEVYYKMREKVGDDFPIGIRFSGCEFLENDEYLFLGQMLEEAGIDFIFLGDGRSFAGTVMNEQTKDPCMSDICANLKKVVSVPVGGAGGIHFPEIAQAFLASGKMDFVLLGRPSIADPEWPNKVKEGRACDVRYCIDCQEGCFGKVGTYQVCECTVNPRMGRETEYAAVKPKAKKKVAVVGGGLAGMQAAITSAELGHDVTLYEASGKLGGQWLLAAVPPHKERFNTQTYWMTRELDSKGVKVFLNTAFDEETAASEEYDAVIVATGSRPVKPPIPGINLPNVVQAHDVLRMDVKLARGENIVVIGGGSVGSETAAYLAAHCNQVTILEMVDTIAADNGMKRAQLMATLQQLHVNAVTGAKVTSIEEDGVCYEKDGSVHKIENVTKVVLSLGSRPNNSLAEKLKDIVPEVISVGDADKVGKAPKAIREGFSAAIAL